MNKTILMCVQPAIRYYSWQIEVMLHNFIDLEIDKHFEIHLLFAYNVNEAEHKANLDRIFLLDDHFSKYYPEAVKFFYYNDTREYPISYISSIRPNALKQHYKEFPDRIRSCFSKEIQEQKDLDHWHYEVGTDEDDQDPWPQPY
jgi:hypothetical protein